MCSVNLCCKYIAAGCVMSTYDFISQVKMSLSHGQKLLNKMTTSELFTGFLN